MTDIKLQANGRASFAALDCPVDAACGFGGDFWDIFSMTGSRTGIMIGDVTGHGVEAAAHAMLIKSVLRLMTVQQILPAEAVTEISRFLLPRLPAESLATVFLGILSPDGTRLTYASAGHEPPVLFSADGRLRTLEPTGPLLGAASGISYPQRTVAVEYGDILALFTDGLVEARQCGTGALLGPERLLRIMRRQMGGRLPLQAAAERIIEEVEDFCGCRPQDDDRLLVLVELAPEQARVGVTGGSR